MTTFTFAIIITFSKVTCIGSLSTVYWYSSVMLCVPIPLVTLYNWYSIHHCNGSQHTTWLS